MAPAPRAAPKPKKLKELPAELMYLVDEHRTMERPILASKIIVYDNKVAIKGRIVLTDGSINEPEVKLSAMGAELVKKVGVWFGLKDRAMSIADIEAGLVRWKDPIPIVHFSVGVLLPTDSSDSCLARCTLITLSF
jgi:hypothetical protein